MAGIFLEEKLGAAQAGEVWTLPCRRDVCRLARFPLAGPCRLPLCPFARPQASGTKEEGAGEARSSLPSGDCSTLVGLSLTVARGGAGPGPPPLALRPPGPLPGMTGSAVSRPRPPLPAAAVSTQSGVQSGGVGGRRGARSPRRPGRARVRRHREGARGRGGLSAPAVVCICRAMAVLPGPNPGGPGLCPVWLAVRLSAPHPGFSGS